MKQAKSQQNKPQQSKSPKAKSAQGKPSSNNGRTCAICGKAHSRDDKPYALVRPGVSALIAEDHPEWGEGKFICRADLSRYRRRYVEHLLTSERGELSALDREVLDSLEKHETIAQPPEEMIEERMTFGDRVADRVAAFGGSWTFILSFLAILFLWMGLNVTGLIFKPFDPYPFIFLNLVLSCIAAIQAPVIMMSQGRQEKKDQIRAENDYKVNLKAELEIRQLHEKIDHQLAHQWERLAELQQIQIDMIEESNAGRRK